MKKALKICALVQRKWDQFWTQRSLSRMDLGKWGRFGYMKGEEGEEGLFIRREQVEQERVEISWRGQEWWDINRGEAMVGSGLETLFCSNSFNHFTHINWGATICEALAINQINKQNQQWCYLLTNSIPKGKTKSKLTKNTQWCALEKEKIGQYKWE